MSEETGSPRVFLSYAWSSAAHIDWVLQLAKDLRANGVDARIDKWHLLEGQDAHTFMESMVLDPEIKKVAVICDKTYAEKSALRIGGVGTEAQIMSSEIYGKAEQTKFVAICREKDEDGKAYLPVFFSSRIYIDLSDSADFAEGFEQLLRWCFDKPLHIAPEIGIRPSFIEVKNDRASVHSAAFERAIRQSQPDSNKIVHLAARFFDELKNDSSDFTINYENNSGNTELSYGAIEALVPVLSKCKIVLEGSVTYDDGLVWNSVHSYLESLMQHFESGSSSWSGDATKFLGHFLFLLTVSVYISKRKLNHLAEFLDTQYAKVRPGSFTAQSATYEDLRIYLESLEARNRTLPQQRVSPHADLIKTVCERIGLSFNEFMQADFTIFLRGLFQMHENAGYSTWYPISLIYAAHAEGSFPLYIRATSEPLRSQLFRVLSYKSSNQVENIRVGISSGKIDTKIGNYSRLNVAKLSNMDVLFDT